MRELQGPQGRAEGRPGGWGRGERARIPPSCFRVPWPSTGLDPRELPQGIYFSGADGNKDSQGLLVKVLRMILDRDCSCSSKVFRQSSRDLLADFSCVGAPLSLCRVTITASQPGASPLDLPFPDLPDVLNVTSYQSNQSIIRSTN